MDAEWVVTAPDVRWHAATGFSALRACNFLLLRQKKVTKEKATPGATPGGARSLARLGRPGGSLNSPAAQTTQPDFPRPACVAQRLPWGHKSVPDRRPGVSVLHRFAPPVGGAEHRRGWRIKGEDCLRPAGPSSAAPARPEKRREPPKGAPTPGRLLFGDFFLAKQEKVTRASSAENSGWTTRRSSRVEHCGTEYLGDSGPRTDNR